MQFEFLKGKTYVILAVGAILLATISLAISIAAYVYLLNNKSQTESNQQRQISDSASTKQEENNNPTNQNDSQESNANHSSISTLPPENEPNDWKTYQNAKYNFKVNIPVNMDALWEDSMKDHDSPPKEYGYQIHFGSREKNKAAEGYDGEWAILIYDKSQTNSEKLIAGMGAQFGATRKEKRENITVNGMPAIKAIVTTSEYPDWYYESVIIEKEGDIYQIGNGAIKNDLFEDFYKSFRI